MDVFSDVVTAPPSLNFHDERIEVFFSHDIKSIFDHQIVNTPPQITAPYSLDLSRLRRKRELNCFEDKSLCSTVQMAICVTSLSMAGKWMSITITISVESQEAEVSQ